MMGCILNAVRIKCKFSVDMMAAAMCMEPEEYNKLELNMREATVDEYTLIASMCANLCIAF